MCEYARITYIGWKENIPEVIKDRVMFLKRGNESYDSRVMYLGNRYKGFNCYSVERVLIDKISVLYADIGTIIRRSRDLYDIYLLSQLNYSMNYSNILRALEDRGIDLSRRSVFEQEIYTEEGSLALETAINKTLVSDKVDTNWVKSYNVTSKKVIESVLHILWMLREGA